MQLIVCNNEGYSIKNVRGARPSSKTEPHIKDHLLPQDFRDFNQGPRFHFRTPSAPHCFMEGSLAPCAILMR